METVKKKLVELSNLRVRTEEQAKAIKMDKDLTAEARRRKLAELRNATDEKLKRLREEYRETVAELQEKRQQEAFGYHVHWAGEKPGERARYTQLLNEVSGKDPGTLKKILQNAKLSGEVSAVRAVLKEAHERNFASLVETCLSINPALKEPYEKVIEADSMFGNKRSVEVRFAEKIALSGVTF